MIDRTIARRFERSEAEATLPLVRRIVADIEADDLELRTVLPALKAARKRSGGEVGVDAELESLRQQVAEITTRFESYLAELARIGCVYRGVTGHVDFRGEHEGRPVFYCWAPGEDEVAHVHLLGADCLARERIRVGAALPLGRS